MIPARVIRVRMDQNTQAAVIEHQPGHQRGKQVTAKATWNMAWSWGPTLTSCHRPRVTAKRPSIHPRSRSASGRVVAGS